MIWNEQDKKKITPHQIIVGIWHNKDIAEIKIPGEDRRVIVPIDEIIDFDEKCFLTRKHTTQKSRLENTLLKTEV